MFKSVWVRSLIFNILLVGFAYIAANIVATTFSTRDLTSTPSADAISETRQKIDRAFSLLSPEGVNKYDFWSNLIENALDLGQTSVAVGYMLAAPQMLPKEEANAINAATNELNFGSRDARLLNAVTLFLPNHVRAKYDNISNAKYRNQRAGFAAEYNAEFGLLQTEEISRQRTLLLGDLNDLVRKSEEWMRNSGADGMELRLLALSHLTPATETEILSMLSIINTAHRGRRLHPEFSSLINKSLNESLPNHVLQQDLSGLVDEISPMRDRFEKFLAAFQNAYVAGKLDALTSNANSLDAIILNTDLNGGLLLIQHAKDWQDIKRLRLIAEAGGPRAVALSDYLDARILQFADSGFRWSLGFVSKAMLLISLALSLVLLCGLYMNMANASSLDDERVN